MSHNKELRDVYRSPSVARVGAAMMPGGKKYLQFSLETLKIRY